MSKRRRLSSWLEASGALSALLHLRGQASLPWLSILTYHRFPRDDGEPFDDGVIDTSVEIFDAHLAALKQRFTVIGTDELCAFAAGGRVPPNSVAITFDDGYLDNYRLALPILQKHGLKAIFFVATSFIDQRRLYWWDRAAYLLKRCDRESITLHYPRPFQVALEPRSQAIFKVLRFVKDACVLDMERFLNGLAEATGVRWSRELEQEYAEQLLMTWDDVRALQQAGMDVESHTRSHRILQTLDPAALRDELVGSHRDLQRELGRAPRAVAYPTGRPVPPSSPIRAALRDAGYEIGLTNGTGPTPTWRKPDPFDIRRQTVARDLTTPFLMSILALPLLAPTHPWHLHPD